MGAIEDDMASIFEHLKEAALTMQAGGEAIGYDFLDAATARRQGRGPTAPPTLLRWRRARASGPITFMDVWDAENSWCRTIMSAGHL